MTKPKKSLKKAVKEDGSPLRSTGKGPGEDETEEVEEESHGSHQPAVHQEASASLKNFRHHPDMENFYRFIYENDLRPEALMSLNQLTQAKRKKT
jgi:hypothetical protein